MVKKFPKPKKLIENLNRWNDKGEPRSGFIRFDRNERTTPFPDDTLKSILGI